MYHIEATVKRYLDYFSITSIAITSALGGVTHAQLSVSTYYPASSYQTRWRLVLGVR